MFKDFELKEIPIVANGVFLGILRTGFSCEELKDIVERKSPVRVKIYVEVK